MDEPRRIAALPHDKHGRPVPFFVAWVDGQPDHRIADQPKVLDAVRFDLCWICGEPGGAFKAFTVGSMCVVNRVAAEPPAHRECAVFSVMSCPFLTRPNMVRRENGKPDGVVDPGGTMLLRNPGAIAVWVTKKFAIQPTPTGPLWRFGDPTEVLWYAEGRTATRGEVDESIRTGLPLLQAEAEKDGPRALADLDAQVVQAQRWLPAAVA